MAFTYFFRDMHTLELIIKHVVPYIAGRSKVRVWDAGCAMGPEPYSLAMMFAENLGHFAFRNFHIDATDLDASNQFGKSIFEGVYKEDALRRIPRDYFKKYFQPDGMSGCFKINELIRSKVFYQRHDLLSLQPVGYGFSLVLCKNVLLHFQSSERIEVIKMFHGALAPGGYFAMEQTQKMPQEIEHLFEQVAPDAQLFRKVETV
ncbi:Chemotaxis protein methyltransferase Cher2 [Pelotomaculum schinkii]|uniref:Chemotaxis protein methyltransferase Cher2 n=1 Tax=Pelotomaculum schinkii TaxID=78350 RepID=A0A4Y7R834_9FIRM|nr:CheR family methyltransferase [Pelotomaculum schinkii]TEB04926.1 Chemotaxis protein methyltransferase Cher2 [Pelotomaculum schinkii]